MKRYLALTLGIAGLGGCAQANRAGDLLLSPPLDVVEGLRGALLWLCGLLQSFAVDLFNLVF